jgi:hypothetical protein
VERWPARKLELAYWNRITKSSRLPRTARLVGAMGMFQQSAQAGTTQGASLLRNSRSQLRWIYPKAGECNGNANAVCRAENPKSSATERHLESPFDNSSLDCRGCEYCNQECRCPCSGIERSNIEYPIKHGARKVLPRESEGRYKNYSHSGRDRIHHHRHKSGFLPCQIKAAKP